MFEALNNYADFSGRARRSEFWLFQLLNIFVLLVSTALIVIKEGGTFVAGVGMLVLWVLVRGGNWGPNNYGPDPVNPWRSGASFA